MYTNSSATYYEYANGKYNRYFISNVFWDDVKSSIVKKTGVSNSNQASVFIPLSEWNDNIQPATSKDLIVRGNCDLVVNTLSPQSISNSLKAIHDADALTVTTFDKKDYGSEILRHVQLLCG